MPNYSIGKYGSIQVGVQSGIGVIGAATREMFAQGATYTDDKEQRDFLDATAGGFSSPYISPVRTSNMSSVNWPMAVDLNGIWLPFRAIMGDGTQTIPQNAANVPATTARQYDWEISPDTGTAWNHYSLYMVHRNDETANVDYQDELRDAFCETLTIASEPNGTPQATAIYRANYITRNDAVLTTPTLLDNAILANKLYTAHIADTYTGMQSSATPELDVYGFTFTLNSGLSVRPRQHGESHLGFDYVTRSGLTAELVLNCYVDVDSAGFLRSEQANHTNGTKRFVKITATGDEIETDHNYELTVGGSFVHTQESMTNWMTYDDGSAETVDINLRCIVDTTSGHDIWARLVNGMSSLA